MIQNFRVYLSLSPQRQLQSAGGGVKGLEKHELEFTSPSFQLWCLSACSPTLAVPFLSFYPFLIGTEEEGLISAKVRSRSPAEKVNYFHCIG